MTKNPPVIIHSCNKLFIRDDNDETKMRSYDRKLTSTTVLRTAAKSDDNVIASSSCIEKLDGGGSLDVLAVENETVPVAIEQCKSTESELEPGVATDRSFEPMKDTTELRSACCLAATEEADEPCFTSVQSTE